MPVTHPFLSEYNWYEQYLAEIAMLHSCGNGDEVWRHEADQEFLCGVCGIRKVARCRMVIICTSENGGESIGQLISRLRP